MISAILTQQNIFITFILGLSAFLVFIIKWILKENKSREKRSHDRELRHDDNFKERVKTLEERLIKIETSLVYNRKEHEQLIDFNKDLIQKLTKGGMA